MKFHFTALCLCSLFALTACAKSQPSTPASTEFTVVTYNVENLFDVDGVALFDDYRQSAATDPAGYSREKFLTKLEAIAGVLKTLNAGAGPEVILFQELEADFTPESTVENFEDFLEHHAETTVADMLTSEWSVDYAGYPASAWLLKALSDHGLKGYEVVTVPSRALDSGIAHTNAIFSRFPISDVRRHPLYQAREIIEAELDVDGHPLIVYVNHWKSGASNPKREPIRVANAKVLRVLIDVRLEADPMADILVAGDLNSHYNHSILYPDIKTGINDVLGSIGDEAFGSNDLYNLWFELSPLQRYSEVWRGRRGTLMHMLVTPGLYDGEGVSYIDGSFDKLVLPGLNADAIGRPLEWSAWGRTGGGASDHFPVYARFRTAPFERVGAFSQGDDAPAYEVPLRYSDVAPIPLPKGEFLGQLSVDEFASHVGQQFRVEAKIRQMKGLSLEVDGKEWDAYVPDRSLLDDLREAMRTGPVNLVVTPGFWKGKPQLVIEGILDR